MGRGSDATEGGSALVRSEEELRIRTTERIVGTVRARKRVETEHVGARVERSHEDADLERHPAHDDDSAQIETLDDGSISIPLLEERLVVRKEVFVRERVVLRKHVVTEQDVVQAELRTEQIEVDASEAPSGRRQVDKRQGGAK